MQQNISDRAYQLSQNGFYFNTSYYVRHAFDTLKQHWIILSAFTALYIGFSFLLMRAPQFGQIVQMIVSGPISAGYYLVLHKIFSKQDFKFENFFDGFKNFLPTMIVNMLIGLFVTVGLFLLVLPGIFLSIIYLFSMPLVVFAKLDFWPAMESSRVIVMKQFKQFFILGIIIVGINILGVLALGVGIFFTIPLSYAIIYLAYKDIYGMEEETETISNDFSHFR